MSAERPPSSRWDTGSGGETARHPTRSGSQQSQCTELGVSGRVEEALFTANKFCIPTNQRLCLRPR